MVLTLIRAHTPPDREPLSVAAAVVLADGCIGNALDAIRDAQDAVYVRGTPREIGEALRNAVHALERARAKIEPFMVERDQ